ncbi:MAG: OmpP1/FadL family transporter [Myxococcota bacterium]
MKRWLVVVTFAAVEAAAAGFAVPEQSARAVGSAGTGTASAFGASTLYYNPGLLPFEDGISAEVSTNLILPTFSYAPVRAVDGSPSTVDPRLFAIPSVFAAAPLSNQLFAGVGAFSNFGLGLSWPATFDGRFEASASNVTTFTVNPSVAYRLNDRLGIGGGVSLVRGTVELAQQINFVDSEGSLRMGGGTFGFGFNLGFGARFLSDRLSVGASWRSDVPLSFQGRADFTVPREAEALLRDQDIRTSLTLPHVVAMGASYRVTPRLRVSGDVSYTAWSSLDALRLDFEDDALDQELRRDWQNTFTARVAGELSVNPQLTVRLGAGFDPTPSPTDTLSPSLPDSDRVLASMGVGYQMGNLTADLGYLLVLVTPRQSTGEAFPARYQGTAHMLGLSVGFRQ